MKYIINNAGIVLFINNKPIKVEKVNEQYASIIKALNLPENKQESTILSILNPKKKVSYTNKGFDIQGDSVFYKGEILPKALAKKVSDMMNIGLPVKIFEAFWENLKQNPSSSSVSQLYDFLAYKELPLTEDGCFLAYKGVNPDFYSIHGNTSTKVVQGQSDERGRLLNSVGSVLEVTRHDVDDDRNNHCSFGLHVGSLDYATGFAHKVVVVKVNPKDVVSVPTDYNCQKCRVSKYEVVSEYEQEIKSVVVDSKNKPILGKVDTKNQKNSEKRQKFLDRIQSYLDKQSDKGELYVKVSKIQKIFSPAYPSKNSVLEALSSLKFNWIKDDNGNETVIL